MLHTERVIKPSFFVIGKEGSTAEGSGFVQRLWAEANSHFEEVRQFAVEENGHPVGFWGLMSDCSRQFKPWEENFTKGLYLAGVECSPDARMDGWTVWKAPAAEYVRVLCDDGYPFQEGLAYLKDHGLQLSGAVYDFTDPMTKKNYLYFPIKRH